MEQACLENQDRKGSKVLMENKETKEPEEQRVNLEKPVLLVTLDQEVMPVLQAPLVQLEDPVSKVKWVEQEQLDLREVEGISVNRDSSEIPELPVRLA